MAKTLKQAKAVGQAKAEYNELESQRLLMARKRAEARVVEIPKVANWKRRNKCKDNPELFCKTYFPDLFSMAFTDNQRTIISAITQRFQTGGYQAIAAERGSGKTTIVKVVGGVWAVLYGHIKFIILIRANGSEARNMLADIKQCYSRYEILAADFPEVVTCIEALDDSPQKAKKQTAKPVDSNSEPAKTDIQWTEDTIVLPNVAMYNQKGKIVKSPSAGAVITTRGIDSSIRGAVKGGRRPDLVILDDIETRESAQSKKQIGDNQKQIFQDIVGLAGPKKKMPIVFVGTVIAKGCITDLLTDRNEYPAWNGIRQKRVAQFPTNTELWQKYIQLRKKDLFGGDATARLAYQFYIGNRMAMDKGAIVSNPDRFDGSKLADGSLLEISAIQAVYNDICDMGMDAFNCEYQNEPVETNAEINKVDKKNILAKTNGLAKGDIAGGKVTAFIDVHDSLLYWSVISWKDCAVGKVIDYGAEDTGMPKRGTMVESKRREFADLHILQTLRVLRDKLKVYSPSLSLIDSGYKPQIVYTFCKESIGANYLPSKGGSGRSGLYSTPKNSRTIRGILGSCHQSYQPGSNIWLVEYNPNHYKLQVHNGVMTADINAAGSISFFGNEPYIHDALAEQIVAEAWNGELKRFVEVTNFGNHWLDCLAGCCVAAHILGIVPIQRRIAVKSKTENRLKIVNNKIRTKY